MSLTADCATIVANSAVALADCQSMEQFAKLMYANDNYAWRTIESRDRDIGYVFTTARITGQVDGTPVAGAGSKGPLLMIHSTVRDATAWLRRTDTSRPTLPV